MKSIIGLIFSLTLVVFAADSIANEYYYFATDDEPLYGTWINSKYQIRPPQKTIYNPDGTGGSASKIDAEKLKWRFRYLITGRWTDDDGNIMYKSHWVGDWKAQGYELFRISNSGNTLEYVFHSEKYPEKIDPEHRSYRIYTRKK
jgi:hypothetical protein